MMHDNIRVGVKHNYTSFMLYIYPGEVYHVFEIIKCSTFALSYS